MFIGFVGADARRRSGCCRSFRGNPSPFASYEATVTRPGSPTPAGCVGALAAYPLSRVLSPVGAGIVCAGSPSSAS